MTPSNSSRRQTLVAAFIAIATAASGTGCQGKSCVSDADCSSNEWCDIDSSGPCDGPTHGPTHVIAAHCHTIVSGATPCVDNADCGFGGSCNLGGCTHAPIACPVETGDCPGSCVNEDCRGCLCAVCPAPGPGDGG